MLSLSACAGTAPEEATQKVNTQSAVAVCAQVIEDSVAITEHVRAERRIPRATPNIVIGGSYGRCQGCVADH